MTIDQAVEWLDHVVDVVAAEAERYMKEYISTTADNPTGQLAGSIYNEKRGKCVRAVGSSLPYAKYANDGRGPVRVKNAKSLHWVYPRPNGKNYFAKEVGPAKGLHFIEKTKEYIENTSISL